MDPRMVAQKINVNRFVKSASVLLIELQTETEKERLCTGHLYGCGFYSAFGFTAKKKENS